MSARSTIIPYKNTTNTYNTIHVPPIVQHYDTQDINRHTTTISTLQKVNNPSTKPLDTTSDHRNKASYHRRNINTNTIQPIMDHINIHNDANTVHNNMTITNRTNHYIYDATKILYNGKEDCLSSKNDHSENCFTSLKYDLTNRINTHYP